MASAEVALDAEATIVGSFTVDGLTYALSGDGATLAAVAPGASGPSAIPSSVSYGGIGYDVVAIGAYAFYLSGATEVALPATVASVDERAFRSSDVERVEVDAANPFLASFDGCLYGSQLTRLLLVPGGRQGAVRIAQSAEEVETSAFSHCAGVDAISADAGSASFASWDGLLYNAEGTTLLRVPAGATDIAIREGCTVVAAGAMEGCARLESIDAPASVASVSPDVFGQETPAVALPIASAFAGKEEDAEEVADELLQEAGDEPDMAAIGDAGQAEASSPSQLTAMVALSLMADDLPEVDPRSITVALPDDAIATPWDSAGFSVEGGHVPALEEPEDPSESDEGMLAILAASMINEDVEIGPDDERLEAPLASLQSADALRGAAGTLTFNANGGTINLILGNVVSGTPINVSPYQGLSRLTIYRTGGTAAPAIFDPSCSKQITFDGDDTVLAGWWNGSNGINYGVRITRSGYTPNGVNGSATFTQTSPMPVTMIDGGEYTITSWTKKPSYSIALDLNGGVRGSSLSTIYYWPDQGYVRSSTSTTVYASTTSAILTSLPTRSGYVFNGYWSAASGGTQYIDASGKVASTAPEVTEPTTLYAHWTPLYTVAFDMNGGSGGTESVKVPSGSPIGSITRPTLSGWTFRGYTDDFGTITYLYVNSSGSGTTRTITGARTLHANWTKTVTLSANSGTAGSLTSLTAGIGRILGQKCSQVASSNVDYPIRSLFAKGIADNSDWAPTRAGYTFGGYWSTSASSGGTCYIDASGTAQSACNPVTSEMPSTLYARWTKKASYQVTLSANNGSPTKYAYYWPDKGYTTSSSSTTVIASGSTLVSSLPTRAGYTFAGYYSTSATAGGTQYVDSAGKLTSSAPALTATATWYARWTAKTITLTWNSNGGSFLSRTSRVYSSSAKVPMPSSSPTKAGYTFKGWFTSTSSTTQITSATALPTSDTTYYAQWNPNVSKITLNANGGEGGTEFIYCRFGDAFYPTEDCDAGTAITTVTPPTWVGHRFKGYNWNGQAALRVSEDGTIVCGTMSFTSPVTWDALWETNTFTISFDANGLSAEPPAAMELEYGSDARLPDWGQHGFVFQGWDTEPDGTGTRYQPGDACGTLSAQDGATVTLYAQYAPAVSADVPLEVTAKVDLLGIEEQVEATGWIESRSGGALQVAEVHFEPLQGAADLFGSRTADVFLEAYAEGSSSADYRFALDAARKEADASKLAPFALPDGYGTRIGVGYRFAIPDDVLAAIDPDRFTEVTTPVGQVVYTVALAG